MNLEHAKQLIDESFKDVKDIFKANEVIIAGGLLTSLFTNKEVNDVDCYFRSKQHLINFLKDAEDEESSIFLKSVTDKSMTMVGLGSGVLQPIYMNYYDNARDIFTDFDWTINMCAYDFKTEEFVYDYNFFVDLASRRLRFNKGTAYPLISALRIKKYTDRGYSISLSETRKVLLEVAKLNINSKEEFIKHIGGMYGIAALTVIKDMQDFDVDKAMELLSQHISVPANIWRKDLPEEFDKPFPCTVENIIDLLECDEANPYIVVGDKALFKDSDKEGAALLYRLFKPECEVNIGTPIESAIYYKWVKEVDGEFVSIFDNDFKYELNKVAEDKNTGVFLLTDEGLDKHVYKSRATHILACQVDAKDFIKFDSDMYKFAVKKTIPIRAYLKDQQNLLLPSGKTYEEKIKKFVDNQE